MEEQHIPMEKRAKGKSNVFKFVTIRNPQSASPASKQVKFIYHPGIAKSQFTKTVNEGSGNPRRKALATDNNQKTSADFKPLSSVEAVSLINPNLSTFSDWLFRNRNTLDVKTIKVTATPLNDEQLLIVWDNLFYYAIENTSGYIREALLMLLVADNFVKKHKDTKLITNNELLRQLASAKIVIPKTILSKPERVSDSTIPKQGNYTTIDSETIKETLNQYEVAIKELQEVNKLHVKNINNVKYEDIKSTVITPPTDGEFVSVSSVSIEDITAVTDNLLELRELGKYVSETTLDVVRALDLSKLQDPIIAINAIEEDARKLNQELSSIISLTKKQVIAGGSILELKIPNIPSPFTGCKPVLVDMVNSIEETDYIQSTASGFGNSGGASQNSILDYGSISFTVDNLPTRLGYHIGLSPQNSDANFNTIKYAIGIHRQKVRVGLVSVVKTRAIAYINGLSVNAHVDVRHGDHIRISRTDTFTGAKIVWELFRPTTGQLLTIHEADDASPSSGIEPLNLDFSFAQSGLRIRNILIDPCKGDDNGSDDNDDIKCSGVTNLGISDYMRVEQEVCCYSAGEVSHIENIMQGEYKERSTRRLRRQETTTTFETETTTEKLRDTTTTDRYEMEQESAQVIQQDSAFDIGVTVSAKYGPVRLTSDAGFATATSSTEANSQAVNYAKEVSSRALDRVTNRVREERVNKVIEEFEENNLHGLDNTNNTNGHATGLYRWVDKIYKNQIVNYGKRLTFEFMIPEPAKFHLWAMANGEVGADIEEPLDPRENGLPNHSALTTTNYATWLANYESTASAPPPLSKSIAKSYSETNDHEASYSQSNNDLTIPEGYTASHGHAIVQGVGKGGWQLKVSLGSVTKVAWDGGSGSAWNSLYDFTAITEGTVPFSFTTVKMFTMNLNVTVYCVRKPETFTTWQIETFNKIINAYKEKKAAYDNAIAEAKAQSSLGIQIQGNNPLYNRNIEEQELKKNCLKWLEVEVGNSHYNELNVCDTAEDMPNMQAGEALACYSQKAKFFEQAFDWDIMSYLFYPYFWGKQCSWKEIYKLDDNDPVFRGFLQAGMARVVVPVKPNYETAIMYYLETGKVWNGGEVPLPEDPLYVSIVDELIEQDPTPVGEPWETRVPTSLNVLQKNSGAVDGDGLPCECTEYEGDGTGGSTLSGTPEGGVGKFRVS